MCKAAFRILSVSLLGLIGATTVGGCGGNGGRNLVRDAGPVDAAFVDAAPERVDSSREEPATDLGRADPPLVDASSGGQALDGTSGACDTGLLWRAVAFAALSGSCRADQAGLAYLVLDEEGRVIHNSYYDGNPAGEQGWLDLLADSRWPCLAGETIHYTCFAQ